MSRPAAPPGPAARRSGYEVVVGLEVHLALRTRTKLFCACRAGGEADGDPDGPQPNRHVCPVCLGLPGALPVPNARAVELAVRFAAALGCAVPEVTAFARKHYGYPDAPKNYQISQEREGREYSIPELVRTMLDLENSGCHNINLVSPTIWIPRIIKALYHARLKGLSIPMVFNTGGYDNPEIIKMLDGAIDIYMPDMRYSDDEKARKYSHVREYTHYNQQSVKEMYRQVGNLKLDKDGIARKGLLIRLLVMPENIGGVKKTLDFIKHELSTNVYLSIMAQYQPTYRAAGYPELNRTITAKEYLEIVKYAEKKGFSYGYTQDYISFDKEEDLFMPDFKKKEIFRF